MSSDTPDSTATFVRGASRTRPLEILIRVVGATATPPLFRLKTGTCVIGSAAPCDIIVSDSTVSRMHAELHLVPEGVAVRDLGSRNGTYYLGQRVEKIVLSPGARVEIGAATLSIEPDAQALGEDVGFQGEEYRGAVGQSAPMRKLFGVLTRLEGSLVTALLEGESGVGKEVVANALHAGSQVASWPMVTVNCGAIPRELVASELFGHKKGAFTGAVEARAGAFDEADGGTLFLDEIGELPLDLQPALLRVLETGEVRAVGADRPHTVRVRVIAATNRDLAEEVAAGRFREDLYYRLAVVRLRIPPLRERVEDIEPLARRFAAAAGLKDVPAPVVEALKSRSYPGNLRELRNAVQAYAALGVLPEPARRPGATLDLALGELVDTSKPYADLKEDLTDRFTRLYLAALLARTGGNQSAAARLAGLDRTHLGRLVAKYGPFGPGGKS
ncbi:MAG: sigma 54-dependent Fis family transcriptional regulator [Polyangiaceae bacterium]|nr:sigma 54-dependent Fis family transcriptional regulator [Polyangiaceae bacterium]